MPPKVSPPIPTPVFAPAAQHPGQAIALMLLATTFIAATTLLAKALGTDALGPPLHALQISHGRFLFAFIALSTVIAVLRPTFGKVHYRLHLGRTFFGWLGVTLMFAAVAFIPLSDATAISFLNPVFAMILAIPLLGERVGPWRWGAAALAFSGALILLRLGDGAIHPGTLLALGAALVMGIEVILIKRLSGRERPLQILFINNAIGLSIATLAVLPVWIMPTPAQWAALAGLGLLMACAQGCFVNAMARAEASLVVPFSYATLLFATLYDALIFDVIPDAISITGGAVIVAAGLTLAWREGRIRA